MKRAPLRVLVLVVCALLVAFLGACKSTTPGGKEGAPLANGYTTVFEGNATLSDGQLSDVIRFDMQDYAAQEFRRSFVDDAAFELEIHYHRQGFPFAAVDYAVETEGEQRIVTFRIEEGPRTTLREIRFEGNREFSGAELRTLFDGPREGLLGQGDLYFVEDTVRNGARAVEDVYFDAGYLDVRVAEPAIRLSEDRRRATVTVEVREGARYRVGEPRLVAAEETDPELVEQARSLLSGLEGLPYAPRVGYEWRGKLLEMLARTGYPEAEVELRREIDAAEARVLLVFRLGPGPRITVTGIRFEGQETTRESFLRSRVTLEEGELYDSDDVRESFRRLYQTGLFQEVSIQLEGEQGAERELVVRVVERPSLEFYVEPGWGAYELLRIETGFRERNLFGTGRSLRVDTIAAIRAQRIRTVLTDPWFLGSEYAANLSGTYARRENPSFTSINTGVGLFLSRDWTSIFETSIGYQYRRSSITDIEVIDAEVTDALDDVDISSFKVGETIDTRDEFFAPRSGLIHQASVEVGDEIVGSGLDFLRFLLSVAGYVPLSEGTVLALGMRTGVILPTGDDDTIPLQERFFNGGENTVRSFREDELGPTDSEDNPIGGEAYSVFNLELRQHLFGNLQGAAFVDAGNVTPRYQDFFDFLDMRVGLGVGVRYMLPIGPVRLDFGINPTPREKEDRWVLQFSVGMAF